MYVSIVSAEAVARGVEVLVLAGGKTTAWDRPSEAAVMAEAIAGSWPAARLLLEEDSLTTLHNLRFASNLLAKQSVRPDRVVIFCDTARRAKVRLLARLVWPAVRRAVVSVDRAEPVKTYLGQIPSTAVQITAFFSPTVERWLLAIRRRRVTSDR
jgi:uncharacterized SAM-binding protein YcdF (DUF218 family)